MESLSWKYSRDDCWGSNGEPLLTACLTGKELSLTLRNSSEFGLEACVSTCGSYEYFSDSTQGPVLKFATSDKNLEVVSVGLMPSGETLFAYHPLALVAQIHCGNSLRLRAKRKNAANWYHFDTEYEDLDLSRLLEPAIGISYTTQITKLLTHESAVQSGYGQSQQNTPDHAPNSRSSYGQPTQSVGNDLIGAAAPLVAFWAAYKIFGPKK